MSNFIAEERLFLVNQIRQLAYNLYSTSLCGGVPILRSLFEEIRNPKIGDTVMEITTHMMKSRDPLEGIGTLVGIAREPVSTREQWIEAGGTQDEEIPTQLIHTITLDYDCGRKFRWENASFIKVKTDRIE